MVDTYVSGAYGAIHEGSSPFFDIILNNIIMYNFLTLIQIILPIAFLIYTFVIYWNGDRHAETGLGRIALTSQASNELFVVIIFFIILQLLVSYLMKKVK